MMFGGVILLMIAMHNDRLAGRPVTLPVALVSNMRELFPGVRVDVSAKTVEFDAQITPMLVKDDKAPLFFLEVLCCAPNTREHETFLITTVRPSHIHAAMLAVGLNAGSPGGWTLNDRTLTPVPPSGDRLSVRIAFTDKNGNEVEQNPLDWIVNARDKAPFQAAENKLAAARSEPLPGWMFTGSKIVRRKSVSGDEREVYDADGSGTIIGLTTFGSEVIGWSRLINPDASAEEPDWIADFGKTPPAETKVRVRIRKAE